MTKYSTPPTSTVPVLIAGAGPAGLAAAITLARYGVDSLVVDSKAELSPMPRASLVSTGSMELFRSWGLEEALREEAIDVRFTGFLGRHARSTARSSSRWACRAPNRQQWSPPMRPLCVTQDVLEPIMLRHLEGLGAGRVEFGTELVSFVQTGDGVRALLRDGAGERMVEAAYLIGADGVRSRVREELGIRRAGPGTVRDAITAMVDVPLDEFVGTGTRHAIYSITHPDAPDGTFVTVSAWRPLGLRLHRRAGHDRPGGLPRPSALERRIRISAGAPLRDLRIGQIGRFSYTALLADRFRDGRAFLAGDAAHQVTPRGGTGMNTAIRDGRDLGWKLAWVLEGWAGNELLDSYERERRPVAEHNMERSVDPNGSIRGVSEELHVDIGPRIPHAWIEPGRSTLDLLGPGFTLLSGPDADWSPARAAGAGDEASPGRDHRSRDRAGHPRGAAGPARRRGRRAPPGLAGRGVSSGSAQRPRRRVARPGAPPPARGRPWRSADLLDGHLGALPLGLRLPQAHQPAVLQHGPRARNGAKQPLSQRIVRRQQTPDSASGGRGPRRG